MRTINFKSPDKLPLSYSVVCRALLVVCCLVLGGGTVRAGDQVVLGIFKSGAEQYQMEFQKYDRMLSLYREHHIQPVLLEMRPLIDAQWGEEQIYKMLKTCNVVRLTTPSELVSWELTDAKRKMLQTAGAALTRFVREGGGLFIEPAGTRYCGQDMEAYWNVLLEPFGMQILHEGCYDKTRNCDRALAGSAGEMFWYTQNIKPHPTTKEVSCLYLPLHGFGEGFGFDGVPAVKYSADWQIVAAGEKEAKSYRIVPKGENAVNLEAEGSYASEPPVAAARSFGKGRVFCYSICHVFDGSQLENPNWTPIVETLGEPDAKRPSDSLKLWMNAYAWLAEPSRDLTDFGTYKVEAYKPVEFPKMADGKFWKRQFAIASATGVRGIVGAHTSYTDGKGTVSDYAKAAKAAGLSMIIFTDPMEKLTAETYAKLKADCSAATTADFCAVPGAEVMDGAEDQWIVWGDQVNFPPTTYQTSGAKRPFPMWDGKHIQQFRGYVVLNGGCRNALLDYSQLRAHNRHPENLWWFWNMLPLVYDRNKLLADNYADYLFVKRDLRWSCDPLSFTRITDPADVALAAKTCFSGFASFKDVLGIKSNSAFGSGINGAQYVSQGPELAYWDGMGTQAGGWMHTGGTQPCRFKFVARSGDGIADVKVHDADQGVIRRFAGDGATELTREFTLCHDKQHYISLEITDTKGRKAFSKAFTVFDYKYGVFRCGDNQNTLCSGVPIFNAGDCRMSQPQKDFHNTAIITQDWIGRFQYVPRATCPEVMVDTKEFGCYPDPSKNWLVPRQLMDVELASQNIQILRWEIDKLAEMGCKYKEGSDNYAEGDLPTDIGDLELFRRTHTMIAAADRRDMQVLWDYRRPHEAMENYRGAVMWHEGEIRFKKDVTLKGAVPVPLFTTDTPIDLEKGYGNLVRVMDANQEGERELKLLDIKKPLIAQGNIRPGGYISELPTPVGCLAFFAPPDSDFTYKVMLPERPQSGRICVGLGHDGQTVKAGTVMKYRFAIGTMADPQMMGAEILDYTARAMNFGGGMKGYPVTMKTGEAEDATFFFTVRAKEGEAVFTLGPKRLLIELPIRVKGVADNGCAAIYTTKRPWFRFVSVVKDTAWFQEDIDEANEIWAGNVFVCDNPAVRMTAVLDGLPSGWEGMDPFIEIHNPTEKEVQATITSPAGTPLVGGLKSTVKIPACDSIRLKINGKQLEKL